MPWWSNCKNACWLFVPGSPQNDRTCVPSDLLAVSTDGLPVALHVRLLEICRKPAQIFGIRQDDMRPMPQKF